MLVLWGDLKRSPPLVDGSWVNYISISRSPNKPFPRIPWCGDYSARYNAFRHTLVRSQINIKHQKGSYFVQTCCHFLYLTQPDLIQSLLSLRTRWARAYIVRYRDWRRFDRNNCDLRAFNREQSRNFRCEIRIPSSICVSLNISIECH